MVRIENSTSGINGLPRRPFVRNACDYCWRNIKGRERKAMSFEYVSVEEAIKGRGLRMAVVGEVPSPWGEAAKGFRRRRCQNWIFAEVTSWTLMSTSIVASRRCGHRRPLLGIR